MRGKTRESTLYFCPEGYTVTSEDCANCEQPCESEKELRKSIESEEAREESRRLWHV